MPVHVSIMVRIHHWEFRLFLKLRISSRKIQWVKTHNKKLKETNTRNTMNTQTLFYCRHLACSHTDRSAKRLPYRSEKSLRKHERTAVHHGRCVATVCSTCQGLKTPRRKGRSPVSPEEGFCCAHTNGCQKTYRSKSNTIRHELQDEHTGCAAPCPRCEAAKHSWKRKREQEEESERIAEAELKRQREEHILQVKAAVESIDWSVAAAIKDQQKYERKQAEV